MKTTRAAWIGSSVGARPAPGRSTRSVRLVTYAVQGALDMVALTAAFLAAAVLRHGGPTGTAFLPIVLPTFLLAGLYGRLYSIEAMTSFGVAAARVALALTATLGLTLLALFAFKESNTFSRVVFFTGAGLGFVFLLLVLAGGAKFPMTNVRQLHLPQWRRLASDPANRCLVPLTAFCEWTPKPDPTQGIKGEMWFSVTDQPIFAVAGLWQVIGDQRCFAMVTCDANDLVRPIHPKAMVSVLAQEDQERWLTGDYDEAVALQKPYPADRMTVEGPVFPTRRSKSAS